MMDRVNWEMRKGRDGIYLGVGEKKEEGGGGGGR